MGPLQWSKIIEMVGIGPAPSCGTVLAGLGAEVIRIERLNSVEVIRDNLIATVSSL